jgi:hypothetical protein
MAYKNQKTGEVISNNDYLALSRKEKSNFKRTPITGENKTAGAATGQPVHTNNERQAADQRTTLSQQNEAKHTDSDNQ